MKRQAYKTLAARAALLLLLLSSSATLYAQKEQDADTLIWNNRKYAILVDHYRPSVVQSYFLRRVMEPPFRAWSTNNYRGHIAYLELIDNAIRLDSIEAKRFRTRSGNLWTESGIDTMVSPAYFNIQSLQTNGDEIDEQPVADWFSGILQIRLVPQNKKEQKLEEARGERWLLIKNGIVQEELLVTEKELKALAERPESTSFIDEPGATPQERLWNLLQRLDDFYRHCTAEREPVTYMGHEGLFDHRSEGLSLLMELYSNDPFAWDQECGRSARIASPMRRWKIMDSIIVMDDERAEWADWLQGEYVIHYGNWETDAMGMRDYRVYKTQRIRLKDGRIMSSQFSPRSFEEDAAAVSENAHTACNPSQVFSVEDKQLWEFVGKLKEPKKAPAYEGDKGGLRAWMQTKRLTDARAKERLFRVRIGFLVNCNGQAGSWTLLNRGKGELNEFAEMVLEIVKQMPQRWHPAEDKKGNKLDCWQVLEFTVSDGWLTNVNYK